LRAGLLTCNVLNRSPGGHFLITLSGSWCRGRSNASTETRRESETIAEWTIRKSFSCYFCICSTDSVAYYQ